MIKWCNEKTLQVFVIVCNKLKFYWKYKFMIFCRILKKLCFFSLLFKLFMYLFTGVTLPLWCYCASIFANLMFPIYNIYIYESFLLFNTPSPSKLEKYINNKQLLSLKDIQKIEIYNSVQLKNKNQFFNFKKFIFFTVSFIIIAVGYYYTLKFR